MTRGFKCVVVVYWLNMPMIEFLRLVAAALLFSTFRGILPKRLFTEERSVLSYCFILVIICISWNSSICGSPASTDTRS